MAQRSPCAAVAQEAYRLHGYWQTLSLRHRLLLLEGLPEAKSLIAESVDGGVQGCDDLMHNLVLAPVAWCYKVR